MLVIRDDKLGLKWAKSENYNYQFNMKTGEFHRWGNTQNDDPKYGALEIFDLEISEECSGIPSVGSDVAVPCKMCYKSNTKVGRNMSFDTFKNIFDKLPQTLTQIAFGIGDIAANKDLRAMMDYCRNNSHNPGVVPNITINGYGLTDEWVKYFSQTVGGIAVSRYDNKDVCYDAVKKLTDSGITQVNIHQVLAEETIATCYSLIDDVATDSRLAKLKAVVFLTLKPKGKRNTWRTIKDVQSYKDLIEYAWSKNVGVGFDSCSQPLFLAAMKNHPNFAQFSQMAEGCESNRFSGYANVDGIYSHCSFTEGLSHWGSVDLKTIIDFDKEVWNSPEVKKFRSCLTCQDNKHIGNEVYLCPVYKMYPEEIGNAASAVVIDDRKTFIMEQI